MTSEPTSLRPGPLLRPTLLPGLRRLWRDRRRLQLGVDPARAVVLELPDAGAARLLDLLDGARSERAVIADAARAGIAERDARLLLAALRAAGLVIGAQNLLPPRLPGPVRHRLADEAAALALRHAAAPGTRHTPGTPAQILRRRAAARVTVAGHGPLVAPVALALAQAGVGHVWPALAQAGVGHVWPALADPPVAAGPEQPVAGADPAAAISRAAPGVRTEPLRRGEASFVVQVGAAGPATLAAAGYARRRLAHLAVSVRDGVPVVGPLVPPGGAPCLNCLQLMR